MRIHLITKRKILWLCSIVICFSFLGFASMSGTFGFRAEAAGSVQLSSGFYAPLDNFDPNTWSSNFGPRSVSGGSSWHAAIDYGRSSGASIYPIYTGEVVRKDYSAGSSSAYGSGYSITIKHTIGGRTIYSHYQHMLSESSFKVGQTVHPYDVIGKVGHSGDANMSSKMGSHLDIRIFEGGTNPWALLNSSQVASTEGNYLSAKTTSGITYYNPAKVLDGTIKFINSDPASNLRFKDVTYPKTFKINKTNGWALGSGVVESIYSLTSIRSEILDSSGGSVSDSGVKNISGYSYSIKSLDDYSGTNNGVRFSWISSAGNYTWRLTATDSGGQTIVMDMPFSAVSSGSTVTATMSKEYVSSQYLDLKGLLDDKDSGNIGGYGTADVYINGSLVANDVDDYYQAWPTGTKYEIKDIKAARGRAYNGSNGSLSGTIGTTTTKVILSFSTIRVTGVALDQSKLTLIPDQTAELTATITPANALDQAVAWTSDDTSVATVTVSGSNSGKATVKAIKKGTVKITCTTSDGSFTASCTVTVKVPVTGITLNSTELALEKGDSATLSATVAPSNASNKKVKWSSSDTNVATVSDGTVKAVGVGNATITCTSADSSEIKATCKVTVEEEFIPFFVFPSSLNEIGEEAFAGIGARRVVVPDGVKTIGKKAFAGCLKLEQITIPASTTTIAKDAFANVPDSFTIHSTLNSYAQTFASENGIRFVADDAYTITFNANGGVSSETTRMIKKGAAIETLPTASKSDNTFDGWYTSASGGTKVTESTVFSSDTIVYAHWKSQTCTITFDANGGSCKTDTKVINKGEAIGTLPTPTRKYYGFKGWYTKQSDGSAITTSTTFSQDQKVYATWELNGFGDWSEWSTTSVTGNDNREVQTEVRSVQTGTKTIYKYKRFLYYRSDKGYYQASYASNWATSNGYSGSWQELTSETKLPVDHTTDGQNVYAGEVRNGNKWWYSESVTTEPIYSNVTYYRYRDRIQ